MPAADQKAMTISKTSYMSGLWLEDQKLRLRTDIPIPKPGPEDALIKISLAGICATDLEMVRGYYPFTGVLGHEFVGEVIQAPAAPNMVGQQVVSEINISCGSCPACDRGEYSHCFQRKSVGIKNQAGVFAEYVVLPIKNLHRVPDNVPADWAVFAEPLAAAAQILTQVTIQPSDQVLVVGAGRLGQLIAQVFAQTGCHLTVVIRHEYQRQILQSSQIDSIREADVKINRMDFVVEATGSPGGFGLAVKAVRPRGTIMLKSTYAGKIEADLSEVVVDEITLIGSRCGPFSPALELMRAERVDPSLLITARYPLSAGLAAIEHASQPGVLKILIEP